MVGGWSDEGFRGSGKGIALLKVLFGGADFLFQTQVIKRFFNL